MNTPRFTSHYRLDRGDAVKIIKKIASLSVTECSELAQTQYPMAYPPPVAPSIIDQNELIHIRDETIKIASNFGFPRRTKTKDSKLSEFDVEIGNFLFRNLNISPADAGLEEIWNFISLVLLPDVSAWRFKNDKKNPEYERWLGLPRNTFRKTWWRAYALGPELNASIGEDEGVNIMERPTFGMNPILAQSIAKIHQVESENYDISKSSLLRRVMVQLGRYASIIELDAYNEQQAMETFRPIYIKTAEEFLKELEQANYA